MNKLIRTTTMVVGTVAMLCIVGCGDTGGTTATNTPEAAVMNLLTTVQSGTANADFLKATCTGEAAMYWCSVLPVLQEELKDATFTVVDKKVDGDKAVVSIKQEGGKHPSEKQEFLLLKVDGRWRVTAN